MGPETGFLGKYFVPQRKFRKKPGFFVKVHPGLIAIERGLNVGDFWT
jgi:hypothetical protein